MPTKKGNEENGRLAENRTRDSSFRPFGVTGDHLYRLCYVLPATIASLWLSDECEIGYRSGLSKPNR